MHGFVERIADICQKNFAQFFAWNTGIIQFLSIFLCEYNAPLILKIIK